MKRSPTPEANGSKDLDSGDADEGIGEDLQAGNDAGSKYVKPKWGKAKVDNRFREELERQR